MEIGFAGHENLSFKPAYFKWHFYDFLKKANIVPEQEIIKIIINSWCRNIEQFFSLRYLENFGEVAIQSNAFFLHWKALNIL